MGGGPHWDFYLRIAHWFNIHIVWKCVSLILTWEQLTWHCRGPSTEPCLCGRPLISSSSSSSSSLSWLWLISACSYMTWFSAPSAWDSGISDSEISRSGCLPCPILWEGGFCVSFCELSGSGVIGVVVSWPSNVVMKKYLPTLLCN